MTQIDTNPTLARNFVLLRMTYEGYPDAVLSEQPETPLSKANELALAEDQDE